MTVARPAPAAVSRPLWVAGVAGGVGTSTCARLLQLATGLPVADQQLYRSGPVDVLVSSITAASLACLGPALARCPRPPVLVVMHTVPGTPASSRSYLRRADPHLTARIDINHRRAWLDMPEAPGLQLPAKATDLQAAVQQLHTALHQMYATHRPSGERQ